MTQIQMIVHAVLVAALLALGGYVGYKIRDANCERDIAKQELATNKQMSDAIDEAKTQHYKDLQQLTTYANQLEAQNVQVADLQQKLSAKPPVLVKRIEVPIDASNTCTQYTLAPGFRMCYNAAITGNPADVAACEASGMLSGSVPASVPAH